jgi:hypothetical protein
VVKKVDGSYFVIQFPAVANTIRQHTLHEPEISMHFYRVIVLMMCSEESEEARSAPTTIRSGVTNKISNTPYSGHYQEQQGPTQL